MRIAIIGGGAVGGLIAHYLYRAGIRDIDVYYASMASVEAVRRNKGITIIIDNAEYNVPVTPYSSLSPNGVYDVVFNCVKSHQVKDTIDLLRRITDSETIIVMLQNGFGGQELVYEKISSERTVFGAVYFGAYRRDRHIVELRGPGPLFIGREKGLYPDMLEIAGKLRRGGCDTRVTSKIMFYRWLKLGVNSVINPLTAIARAPNKIVLTPAGLALASEILDEVVLAAEKHGIKLDKNRLLRLVKRIAESTRDNYSSMAQDILAGRRTEIDYINGYVAKIVGDGVNKTITHVIHLIEAGVLS
ncbi:MAG: 2-dehydropantoate 2-reductase [Crenarchaeota archaeon]|nr:2-dehydropantoate 2-reductase [Thermoproteota archaeon]